jgi:excinuclease UvrABC ATPase subunit
LKSSGDWGHVARSINWKEDAIDDVILVDQSPINRTPRSISRVHRVYDGIRDPWRAGPARGLIPRTFSY